MPWQRRLSFTFQAIILFRNQLIAIHVIIMRSKWHRSFGCLSVYAFGWVQCIVHRAHCSMTCNLCETKIENFVLSKQSTSLGVHGWQWSFWVMKNAISKLYVSHQAICSFPCQPHSPRYVFEVQISTDVVALAMYPKFAAAAFKCNWCEANYALHTAKYVFLVNLIGSNQIEVHQMVRFWIAFNIHNSIRSIDWLTDGVFGCSYSPIYPYSVKRSNDGKQMAQ